MKRNLTFLLYGVVIMLFVTCKKNVNDEDILIMSFDPVKGAKENKVSIKGKGFGTAITALKLTFNGTQAIISSLTDTTIATEVPQGATTGKISVSSNGRSATSQDDFIILPGTWIRKNDLPASGRIFASAFSIDDKGYMGNGFANDGNGAGPVLNDWWQYDPVADQWIQKAIYPGGKRSDGIAFVINNIGYVGTGWDDLRQRKKDIWAYDPMNNQWTRKADMPGPERIDGVGFGIGNKAYAGTGDAVVSGNRVWLNDWWEYDPATDHWTQKTSLPSQANQHLAGFVILNKLYVGMGRADFPVTGNKEWWTYDPLIDSWTRKADFPASGSNNPTPSCSFVIDNKGYIMYVKDKAQFWQYDPALDQWKEQAFFDPSRLYSIAFTIGNKGYLGTGLGSPPQWPNPWTPATKDIWQFSPAQ